MLVKECSGNLGERDKYDDFQDYCVLPFYILFFCTPFFKAFGFVVGILVMSSQYVVFGYFA